MSFTPETSSRRARRRLPRRLFEQLRSHPAGKGFFAALSGTLLFLSCADFDIWPLTWIGLLPLLWVLLDEEGQPHTQHPFWYGYITGLFANGGGFYWIVGLLMRFGHLPFLAALPIFLLLIAYQALTFGLFASILCRLRRHVDVPIAWLAPLVFVACELCVPYVFPWYLAITQAWVPPVIQIADITGPLGVSFMLVLANGALFQILSTYLAGRGRREGRRLLPRSLHPPLVAILFIVLCLGYGAFRIHQTDRARAHAPKIKIGVVQANIGIHEKFVPGLREEQHAVHLRLSQELSQQGADLIVWPESSYPYPLSRSFDRDFPIEDARKLQRGFFTPLLFGALTVDHRDGSYYPYNSALFLDKNGRLSGSFDKNFLLIFGEYLPFARQLQFLRELIPEISNFERGTETRTFPFEHNGQKYFLGPMICYEDIIPAFGRRLFADNMPPNLLINLTNDAWFGATSEPYEHLALSVFRAVEHRVDLVRAVNTGVSAFIDASGRVYKKSPAVDPQLVPPPGALPISLLAEATLLPPGGLYQRLGETFGGACLCMVLLLGLLARRRAGLPLYLGEFLLAVLVLHAALLTTALFLPGKGLVSAFYAVLFHRGENALIEAMQFQAAWQLLVVLIATCMVLGIWRGRHLGPSTPRLTTLSAHESGAPIPLAKAVPGRLELILAVIATTALPVALGGKMEGNTGAVVILSLLSIAAGLLGLRIGHRLFAAVAGPGKRSASSTP